MRKSSPIILLSASLACAVLTNCQSIKVPSDIEGVTQREASDYGRIPIGDRYVLLNDVWNKQASFGFHYQDVFCGNSVGRDFIGCSWNWSSNGRMVVSYPNVYCGSSPWDPEYGTASEMPFPAGSKSVTATFDVDLAATGKYDMAFDIYVISRLPNVRQNLSHEIMIWNVNAASSDWSWATRLGSPVIDDVVFDVYKDLNHVDNSDSSNPIKWTVLIFAARKPILNATLHIDHFIQFLLDHGELSPDNYICNVEFGVEPYYGSGIVKIYDYSLDVR